MSKWLRKQITSAKQRNAALTPERHRLIEAKYAARPPEPKTIDFFHWMDRKFGV